jgi:hypothetical protein
VHRPLLALTGVALLLGLAACGSSTQTPSVATAQSTPAAAPAPSRSSNAIAQYVDAQRKWVKCMRDQGYNLPDPDAKGSVDISPVLRSMKISKADPGLMAALQKCQSLQVPAPAELTSRPPITAEQLANLRKYAKCVREHGVPSYPDPLANGEWPPNMLASISPEEAAKTTQAYQICDPVAEGRPPAKPDPNFSAQG